MRSSTASYRQRCEVVPQRGPDALDARQDIVNTKIITLFGASVGSVVGGVAGARVGMMTGYFSSLVGLLLGLFLARRFVREYLE